MDKQTVIVAMINEEFCGVFKTYNDAKEAVEEECLKQYKSLEEPMSEDEWRDEFFCMLSLVEVPFGFSNYESNDDCDTWQLENTLSWMTFADDMWSMYRYKLEEIKTVKKTIEEIKNPYFSME